MRRTITIFMLLAAVAVPAAYAEDGPPTGGDRPAAGESKTRQAERQEGRCRPGAVLVAGTFVSATDEGFSMLVKRANRKGHALVGKTVDVRVLRRTVLRGLGDAELTELAEGTRVVADLRVCKTRSSEAEATAGSELVAAKAAFHAARPDGERPKGERPERERPAPSAPTVTRS